MVIARLAGSSSMTIASPVAGSVLTTCMSLSSGRYCATGASSSSLPSSTSIMVATLVICLDIDPMRKIKSGRIGIFLSWSAKPVGCK